MAELVALMVRGLQSGGVLMIIYIFLAPVITFVAPFIWLLLWPILLIGSLIGLYRVLGSIASRLEEAKGE